MSQFYVDRIKQTNLLETYDVLEIPAHERINLRQRCQRDVRHVRRHPCWQNFLRCVGRDQRLDFLRNRQHPSGKKQHLLMQIPHRQRGVRNLSRGHIGEQRNQTAGSKIVDQRV